MPPSWCWTVLRFSSTLTRPEAITAPESGASVDHITSRLAHDGERDQRVPPQSPQRLVRARICFVEE